jgi:hypothetical protein
VIITEKSPDNKIAMIIMAEIIRRIAIIIGLYSDQEAITRLRVPSLIPPAWQAS